MMPEKDTAAVSFCKSELRVLPKTCFPPQNQVSDRRTPLNPFFPPFKQRKVVRSPSVFPQFTNFAVRKGHGKKHKPSLYFYI